nr:hypothetical protein CFP56_03300 [Quercus suber]
MHKILANPPPTPHRSLQSCYIDSLGVQSTMRSDGFSFGVLGAMVEYCHPAACAAETCPDHTEDCCGFWWRIASMTCKLAIPPNPDYSVSLSANASSLLPFWASSSSLHLSCPTCFRPRAVPSRLDGNKLKVIGTGHESTVRHMQTRSTRIFELLNEIHEHNEVVT